MTKLSVNVNKIATLRNARGGNNPDLEQVVKDCQRFGAQGITIHPRPDERHITTRDVYNLKPIVTTEFNIEGYPDERFFKIVADTRPEQATLVPDPPDTLTSDAGWDAVKNRSFLTETVARLKEIGCRVSLFTDPSPDMVEAAALTGTDRIELYTEAYAVAFSANREVAVAPYMAAAAAARSLGLGINAGHDLNLENLPYFRENIEGLLEVSIGHALICDALYLGLENTVKLYLKALR